MQCARERGPLTAGPPTATRTRIATPPGRSRWCTTASSRTSPRCAASWRRPGWSFAATPTPRWRCTWSPAVPARGDRRGFRGVGAGGVAPAGGPFHAGVRQRRRAGHDRGGRRSTPLVLGVGEGEMFVGSDVAAFIEHTRDAVELGQDQAVVITAEGYTISDFHGNPDVSTASFASTGTCPPRRRAAMSTSCSRRSPSSPPRWPTPCWGISSTAASCSTSSG